MAKKTKPDVWTLEITELPQSPFVGERRRQATRFQGVLRRNGSYGSRRLYGHTREDVIREARAEKLHVIEWEAAEAKMERIEI